MSTTHSTIHRRLSTFVSWLAPEADTEADIRKHAKLIRERLSSKSRDDGLIVHSTPNAGSFAKRTGLRRHLMGGSDVEGLDVDLPFVVSPEKEDDRELPSLLDRFSRYARESYPDTECKVTRSSVQLSFVKQLRSYDIVPMLATSDPERQIIVRANGERVETSVQQHVDFTRSRNKSSNAKRGRVKFNECVRLVKWFREFREDESTLEVPSFVIDLLCAQAYDHVGVELTYHATLAAWFGYVAHVVRKRLRVAFDDYSDSPEQAGSQWEVLDPVTPSNNIVQGWSALKVDELASWFSEGRDSWARAIRADFSDDDVESLKQLQQLFGSPFKHHCED